MRRIDLNEDTIAAIASPFGEGAVGIVRVSGRKALDIVDKIFSPKNKRPLSSSRSFSLRYGWIVGKSRERLDEVIVSLMRGPKSYTREDVVEINSHGGPRVLAMILEWVLENGARLAQPGEFTKRAFLNGRLDLAQAEAVLDIIQSKSELALKNSLSQLEGAVSRQASELRTSLLELLADMEARIDFSEDDAASGDADFLNRIAAVSSRLKLLVERSLRGRIIREGLNVVIYGRPNVGKSSLLNAMLRQERAIVTPIAGTTRDTIEEFISIKGLAVRLIDTAGMLEHRDEIEKEALARTRKALEASDLVLFVLDASAPLSDQDRRLAQEIAAKEKVVIINKSDLEHRLKEEDVRSLFRQEPIFVSAVSGENILAVEDKIHKSVFDKVPSASEGAFMSNARHIDIMRRCLAALEEAGASLSKGLSLEFAVLDIKKALESLGEVTGEVFSEELLDVIFSKFCVGK